MSKDVLIVDTEVYPNLFSIGFRRYEDRKTVVMYKSDVKTDFDKDRMIALMRKNRIVTYNGMGFDLPIITMAGNGASTEELYEAAERIIKGGIKWWDVEDAFGIRIPKIDHIDLMEVQPNAFASLKTLQGRLHGKKMQDLPYKPGQILTEDQIDQTIAYMGNDLDATCNLYGALIPDVQLRDDLSEKYCTNFRCKSDAQIGEGIIKLRAEEELGHRIYKPKQVAGHSFSYMPPDYLKFQNPVLRDVVEKLRQTTFITDRKGKTELPEWLDGLVVEIGDMGYKVGIGGLHSTEKNRGVVAGPGQKMRDEDVTSYYPKIIVQSGLSPKSVGPVFTSIYNGILETRVAAKKRGQEIKKEIAELLKNSDDRQKVSELRQEQKIITVMDKGGKISANGAFGKLGSIYSVLNSPDLLIYVTITGQLSLLLLIEWAVAAGIRVVSANTDGVVFLYDDDQEATLDEITARWQAETGFNLEQALYDALYSASVNSYIALKPGGKTKAKGPIANPWRNVPERGIEPDVRGMLMKNPQMTVISDAVMDFLSLGIPVEDTIRNCRDIRSFITVVNVKGGGTWGTSAEADIVDSNYLGKVVRYYWSTNGKPIYYSEANEATGNYKMVANSDGCVPMMELPDSLDDIPPDLDYNRYIEKAKQTLVDFGYYVRSRTLEKPSFRLKKRDIAWWWVLAV